MSLAVIIKQRKKLIMKNENLPESTELTYHLLDDGPAEEDKFGAHKRIADAIASLIQSNHGGKTVALKGDWGSGKSTTIRQLEKKLDSNHIIFTYDTWVHSGDHLRKAFLNELINLLLDNKWLSAPKESNLTSEAYWEKEKEMLAGRLKITSKSVEPEFTEHGKIIIPSLLAMPLATVLFNNLIQGYIKDQYFFTPWHLIIHIVTVLSLFLMIFPFGYIIWNIRKGGLSKILSLIVNKSTLDERQQAWNNLKQPQ